MSLSHEKVANIAHLARIAISENEYEQYAQQLNKILEFVDQLQAVDTADIEPMAHPLEMQQRLRVDQVIEEDQRDAFQAVAPRVEAGLYLVPKVID